MSSTNLSPTEKFSPGQFSPGQETLDSSIGSGSKIPPRISIFGETKRTNFRTTVVSPKIKRVTTVGSPKESGKNISIQDSLNTIIDQCKKVNEDQSLQK